MISAVVVSCNEGHLLDRCLASLSFCDEIVVVDLQSTDNTKEIALKHSANYILKDRVPVVEMVHTWVQDKTKYDWILITDPDEVCNEALATDLIQVTESGDNLVGSVRVPWRFYFGKHLLKGTQWGGVQRRVYLVNRNGFYFTDEVHRGRHLKEGYKQINIEYSGDNFVRHYWMQDVKQLISKHKRYLQKEGVSRFNSGGKTSIKQIVISPIKEFNNSFLNKKGYRDGFTGLFLSCFWAWYETKALYNLYRYQKKQV